jgi:dTDP-4-amino-4,6-dideoxygalactose transaminase
LNVAHAVAVSNGTAALHLALLALDVGPGHLVPVTAYSWPATANAIELCGARPVFVDIDRDTGNLDPQALDEVMRTLMADAGTARRVRAIMIVHAFGQMADMPRIMAVANRYRLPVIEDAACALGAAFAQKQAGTWGQFGCFSFHPRKNITTGEGGLIVTPSAEAANRLRALRNHGLDPTAAAPDFIMPGYNYRMTEFQAALGTSQLGKLDRIIQERRGLAQNYDRLLRANSLNPPVIRPQADSVYQSYVIQLPPHAAEQRVSIIQQLKLRGIETNLGTWHMPMTTYFRTRYNYRAGDFPATDAVFRSALTLPLHGGLSEADQTYIVAQLLDVMGAALARKAG